MSYTLKDDDDDDELTFYTHGGNGYKLSIHRSISKSLRTELFPYRDCIAHAQ
jgi:hypothetical protein